MILASLAAALDALMLARWFWLFVPIFVAGGARGSARSRGGRRNVRAVRVARARGIRQAGGSA
jgi:hypothetical protein